MLAKLIRKDSMALSRPVRFTRCKKPPTEMAQPGAGIGFFVVHRGESWMVGKSDVACSSGVYCVGRMSNQLWALLLSVTVPEMFM